MSDGPSDYQDCLNLREQIARIDRNQAEIQRLYAEHEKLSSRDRKFNRDPWILLAAAFIGGCAAIAARLPEILKAIYGQGGG